MGESRTPYNSMEVGEKYERVEKIPKKLSREEGAKLRKEFVNSYIMAMLNLGKASLNPTAKKK